MEEAKIVVRILAWVAQVVIAVLDGQDHPAAKRLRDILPTELRADIEAARQRRQMEAELRDDLDEG